MDEPIDISPVHDSSKENEHWTNSVESEPPQFSAKLVPYRSLSKIGFLIVVGFIGINCFVSGLMFWQMGAWPVTIFLFFDVLIIWAAFHFNYRSARGYEEVAVWRHIIHIRKFAPNGRWRDYRLNPFWTRFKVDRHEEIGITRMALEGEGQNIDIGHFLNPKDRESFALAFGRALARSKA